MSNDAILPLLTYTIFKHLSLGEIIFGEEKNHLINPEFSPSKWASGISTIPTPGSKKPLTLKALGSHYFSIHKNSCFLHCYGFKCNWNAGCMSRFQTTAPHTKLGSPGKPVSPICNYFNYPTQNKFMLMVHRNPSAPKCPSYLLFPVITAGEKKMKAVIQKLDTFNTWCQA